MRPDTPTLVTRLESMYRCRETEGGCGARRGEKCKTFAAGKPTQPHADRWRQWELAGNPGAWWHEPGALSDAGTGTLIRKLSAMLDECQDLLDRIGRSLAPDEEQAPSDGIAAERAMTARAMCQYGPALAELKEYDELQSYTVSLSGVAAGS